MSEVVQVGLGIFVVRDGKILLGKRKGSHGAGEWALPGGKPDFGEPFHEAICRELFEETGLKPEMLEELGYSEDYFPDDGKHFATLFYVTNEFTGELETKEPDKCEEWKWFGYGEFPSPMMAGTVKMIDEKAFSIFGLEER